MLIYPAIDIYAGNCVRLRQGDFSVQSLYSDSPSAVARSFAGAGLINLHVVDLEGAKAGRIVNWNALSSILSIPGIEAQIGGGIRTRDEVSRLFDAGAARVVIGSLAVQSPHILQEWMKEFGSGRFVIAVDVRGGMVAHTGWLERANLSPHVFIRQMIDSGAQLFLCTDIDLDGMLQGPNLELYRSLVAEFPSIRLIASGGVSALPDLTHLALCGCSAAVVGKALYEQRITLADLVRFARG